MRDSYQAWLEEQSLASNTIQAQVYRAGQVEKSYGDLDEHYDQDQLQSILSELRYSSDDGRRNRPNPSKLSIGEGADLRSNLASYKNATERYCKFRRETDGDDDTSFTSKTSNDDNSVGEEERGQIIGLERDMQSALRQSIEQLEPGLEIIDGGAERSVSSGFIDITTRDASGATVVIELKTGTARQKAVGQILSYMGDLMEEEPSIEVRGILVAADFDKKARAAARIVPSLSLQAYRVNFHFTSADEVSF